MRSLPGKNMTRPIGPEPTSNTLALPVVTCPIRVARKTLHEPFARVRYQSSWPVAPLPIFAATERQYPCSVLLSSLPTIACRRHFPGGSFQASAARTCLRLT